jgi:hypothetical protein
MNVKRLLFIPVIVLFTMACGLTNGIQQIKEAVTSAPGAISAVETAAAGENSIVCGAPTPGGMNINTVNARAVLQITGLVNFEDSTVNGSPETTMTLTDTGAGTYPAIAEGASVEFIGESCNLSLVHLVIPRTDQQETVDQGLGILNFVLAASMPLDVQLPLLTWLNDNYASLAVGSETQTTLGSINFTMQRTSTEMILEATPTP